MHTTSSSNILLVQFSESSGSGRLDLHVSAVEIDEVVKD